MKPKTWTFAAVQKEFGGIASIHRWLEHMEPTAEYIVASYKQGELICDSPGDGGAKDPPYKFCSLPYQQPLGLVLDGTAEIYDFSCFNHHYAYRPIGIVEQGSILGDFLVVDHALGKDSAFRRDEKWQIKAGRVSSFVIQRLANPENAHLFKDASESNWAPHRFLDLHDNSTTSILFWEGSHITRGSGLFDELIAEAWVKAIAYRQCVNSFNYGALLDFRALAITETRKTGVFGKHTKKKSMGAFFDIFIDALYDALNRPIRGEPMFVPSTSMLSAGCIKELKGVSIDVENFLTASTDCAETFFYPLDEANYLISNHLLARGFDGHKFTEMLGGHRTRDGKPHLTRHFYLTLAQHLLSRNFITSYIASDYKYLVECQDIQSLAKRHLVIRFTSRERKK